MQKKTMGILTLGAAGLVAASVLVTLRFAHADGVPGIIPVQGCATDAMGKALDGAQQVEFRLYATANAAMGDAVHLESRNVTFRGCVFSETIHPADLGLFEKYGALYLGIKIAGDAELSPRFEVGTAPYAVQARHADKASRADNGVPPGTIVAFGGVNEPAGWLPCNGKSVSKKDYPELWSAIGTAWGAGDGQADSFNLPDLRGRFARGWDGNSGHDPEASGRSASAAGGVSGDAVGTLQGDALRSHSHGVVGHLNKTGPTGAVWNDMFNYYLPAGMADSSAVMTVTSTGGPESRPTNVAVNYVIKY